jgi:hypothetical protein
MRYQSEWRGQGTKGKRNARCEVIGKRAEKSRKEKKRKEKKRKEKGDRVVRQTPGDPE